MSADDVSYLDPETIGGLNLYAYCNNNPVMNIDPEGTFFLTALLIGALVGVAIGGTVAGIKAAEEGLEGWDLVGEVAKGALIGGATGAVGGAGIGLIGAGAAAIGGGSMALIGGATLSGGAAAVAATGAIVVGAGASVASGITAINILLAKWIPGSWPGDDPTIPPGDGFIWRGPGEVGSKYGEWYNPQTHDQLHPDLHHPLPKGPHWGWKNKLLKILMDIFK